MTRNSKVEESWPSTTRETSSSSDTIGLVCLYLILTFCLILSMCRLCMYIISTIFFRVLSEFMKKFTKWSCFIFFFGRYVFRNNKRVGLKELGPRFTLKLRSLQKGTFDSKYGEYEWVHKVGIVFLELMFSVSEFICSYISFFCVCLFFRGKKWRQAGGSFHCNVLFFPNKFFKMPHCFILILLWKRRCLKYFADFVKCLFSMFTYEYMYVFTL